MAERSVVVRLKADVADFQAKMAAASATSRTQLGAIQTAAQKNSAGFTQLGTAAAVMGGAMALGVGLAINAFANFDQAMSNVQAATHESASAMAQLREAALQAGADTAFSATEAASGIEELAKAGISTADIIGGGLAGALDLAAAGGISVAEAAETTATALQVFNLEGSEASHVADLLAAGAGKAQGSVTDIGMALDQSALVANQFGLSIEETTGALALFASEGLTGSDAGTAFKTMLLSLANPSTEAAATMKDLGINMYDSTGAFIGMEGAAEQLKSKMAPLSQETRNAALATIFGRDAIRSAAILYEGGAESVETWTANVNDSGYAAETAAIRMDNLKGDLEKLSGSLETALIGLGSAGEGPLRSLVQTLTNVVNAFSGLGPGAQAAVLGVGGLVAAVGLLGGAALILIPKIAATSAAISSLGITAAGAAAALGVVTAVVAGVAAAFVGMNALDPAQSVEELADAMARLADTGDVTGALANIDAGLIGTVSSAGDLAGVLGEASEEMNNWWDAADSLVGTSALEDIRGIDEALAGLASSGQAEAAAEQFAILAEQGERAGLTTAQFNELFPAYIAGQEASAAATAAEATALTDAAAAAEAALPPQENLTAALADQAETMEATLAAWQALNDVHMSAAESEAAYQQSIDDTAAAIAAQTEAEGGLQAALNETMTGFNLNEQAGRDLQASLFDTATSGANAAVAARDLAVANGTDVVAANNTMIGSLGSVRGDLSTTLQSLGITKVGADALALSVVNIPDSSLTQITADTTNANSAVSQVEARFNVLEIARNTRLEADPAPAIAGVNAAQAKINSLYGRNVSNTVTTYYYTEGTPGQGGAFMAYGGRVAGHSASARADNIPAWLTAGEYVLPVPAVSALEREYGPSFLEQLREYRTGAGLAATRDGGGSTTLPVMDAYTFESPRGGDGASAQSAAQWTSRGASSAVGWAPPPGRGGLDVQSPLKEGDMNITNVYPSPERASDAVARSARTAITLRRMGR